MPCAGLPFPSVRARSTANALPLKKQNARWRHSAARARSNGKTAFFHEVSGRMVWDAEHPKRIRLLEPVNTNFTTILIDKTDKLYIFPLLLGAMLPRIPDSSLVKARWGRDGGLGGKGPPSRAGGDRKAARRAVPVRRRRSLTGIDSRARASPSPQTNS